MKALFDEGDTKDKTDASVSKKNIEANHDTRTEAVENVEETSGSGEGTENWKADRKEEEAKADGGGEGTGSWKADRKAEEAKADGGGKGAGSWKADRKAEEVKASEGGIEAGSAGKAGSAEKTGNIGKAGNTGKAGSLEKVEKTGVGVILDDAGNVGKQKSGKKTALILCLIFIPLFILLGIGGWYYVDSQAYKVCRAEAGVAVSPSDFLKRPDENASFAEGSEPFDIAVPGEYHVKVKSGLFTHDSTLIIEDTIAPSGDGLQVQMEIGNTCGAEEFVANISDATAVTVSFASEPDFTKSGSQSVQIILEDKGGNQTAVDAGLFITQVVEVVTVEAGGEAPGLESFIIAGQDAAFITDMDEIDYMQIGKHEISVTVDGADYVSILQVVDTTPPQAEVRDVEGYALVPRTVEEFVVAVEDVTEVAVAFRTEPDLSLIGTQELEIVFMDGGGNETAMQAKLTLIEDFEVPIIKGAKDLTSYVGDGVSYRKNVTVTDNCPEGLELTVDTSAVNLDAEGVYPVTYIARDLAGNTARMTVNLTVKSREFNPDQVYALADKALAGILKEGMTDLEKVTAIYDYVKGHVGYVSHSEKGDWLKAAYDGLSTGKGDCYTYAHTSRLLLDRAGITNMIIEKIPAATRHVWNLVDIGDGWYHFDACPRRGLTEKILMWTDERLMEYSNSHNKSHNYDRDVYTDIN